MVEDLDYVVVFVEDHDVIAAGIAQPVPLQCDWTPMTGTGITAQDISVRRADQVRASLGHAVFVLPEIATVRIAHIIRICVNCPQVTI